MEDRRPEEAREEAQVVERDATLDEEPIRGMSADELQDTLLEDSGMNAFQKFCARMDDARWALAQRVTGAVLGVIAGISLFWDTLVRTQESSRQQGIFSLPLVIAIIIALIVPNIIEKQGLRSVPKLRIAMVISLAAVIVIYFIVVGVQTGFHFTA